MMGFDTDKYKQINKARLAHLKSLGYIGIGTRVLDIGCGIGQFAEEMMNWGAIVHGIEGRATNSKLCRFPVQTADIRNFDFAQAGEYDVAICYGLLYHLDKPDEALANIARVKAPVLIIESKVTDSKDWFCDNVDDNKSDPTQSLDGKASIPSIGMITSILTKYGRDVFIPNQPDHKEFNWQPEDNMANHLADGSAMRMVFIAYATN